ncbi:ABC transporter ATP-binding protein [Salegentibacter mishustinae]|uniref:ABC transporter ATP-binding protein n=1 Tax=Salegentibacter mishustinae TaxID=270918 RepID=UPI002492FFE2|nr:ABC transporter ATP-binding protein [Salegentibacter mishustinae]
MAVKAKIKDIVKKNFEYFFYFYGFLRYRIFIAFFLSILKGTLDGFGLAMFIPLLRMSSTGNNTTAENGGEELGKLSFLPEFLESIGITLNLVSVLLIILGFFGLKGIVTFIEGYYKVIYQQLFMREIRITNINLLNTYSFKSFLRSDPGMIQNTFSSEVGRVNIAYRSYFRAIEYGVLITVYLVLAFSANSEFAIIVAVGGALSNFLFKWLFKKTKSLSRKYTVSAHRFQGFLIQHVAIYKYLKATGINKYYGGKLKHQINDLENLQKRLGIVDSTLKAMREPITMLVVVLAILIQVTYFDSDIGLIILSLLFLYRAMTYLMSLQEHWNKFLGASAALENMKEFTSELRNKKEKNGIEKFNDLKQGLRLTNVSFNYNSTPILRGINFEVKKNESIAIIGESGSGKTTLMNILAGLILPEKGELLIDGVSTRQLDLYSYRKRIGYISQEAPIFNDTVFNNVTLWAEKSDENLIKFDSVLKQAAIYEFVYDLENKEDEFLGNNGINISGGQRQRLSIARELFKEVDFLFMDEATSALDGETERAIQQNIDNLKGMYTIFMVAHRLATIINADRIILLKNGEIEAIGSFMELLDKSDNFKEMISLQGMSIEKEQYLNK